MAEVLLDEGCKPFNFDDPRCPICGAEMTQNQVQQIVEYVEITSTCRGGPFWSALDQIVSICRNHGRNLAIDAIEKAVLPAVVLQSNFWLQGGLGRVDTQTKQLAAARIFDQFVAPEMAKSTGA